MLDRFELLNVVALKTCSNFGVWLSLSSKETNSVVSLIKNKLVVKPKITSTNEM